MSRVGAFCLPVGVVGLLLAPGFAAAQRAEGGRAGAREAPAAANAPRLSPEPTQRLDAGATLCRTEAALQLHQDAVLARLNGREGVEPAGCRVVQSRMAVAVLGRHGPSHTEVRAPGPPEQVGWTDAMVRNP